MSRRRRRARADTARRRAARSASACLGAAGPRTRAGFTLIEVLVALAIVTIGMAAVMEAISSSAGTLSYLRDKTFAQWVALNRVATLRLAGQQPPLGKSDGEDDFAGRRWHWRQEVVRSDVPGIERIDVSVRPADIKPANEDSGWFTTVSGLWGDAVDSQRAGGVLDWGAQLQGGVQTPGQLTPGALTPGGASQPFTPHISQPPAPTQPIVPGPANPGQLQ